jgi:hypothetical protein
MGYDNSFSLKVDSDEKQMKYCCPEHNNKFYDDAKFCPDCGKKLEPIEVSIDGFDIIQEFRDVSEEASYLLTDDGGTNESGSGYKIIDELIKFSKTYPNVLFELYCEWDKGFGDPPSKFYVKNGKSQECKAEYLFPPFDESKMKSYN